MLRRVSQIRLTPVRSLVEDSTSRIPDVVCITCMCCGAMRYRCVLGLHPAVEPDSMPNEGLGDCLYCYIIKSL